MDTITFDLNGNHRSDCPCYACLKVGDKVFAYLNDGDFSEEIVVEISRVEINRGGAFPISVGWPSREDGNADSWCISVDPHATKTECEGTGKMIRKATPEDLAREQS